MAFKNKKFILVMGFIVFFIIGFLSATYQISRKTCPPSDINFSLFWEVYNLIEERFVDSGEINKEDIIHGAISGMIKALDDPHTAFFTPEEARDFEQELSGFFEGIGIEIGIREKQLTVISPIEQTPAHKAGLRAGDRIMKIDDKDSLEMSIEKAVSLIRGPKGEKVTLTVLRKGTDSPLEFEIIRDTIKIPTLKLEQKEGNIAYLRLYHFNQLLLSDFREAAMEILASDNQGIILDLRNNPGGFLNTAIDIAGWFVEKGKIVTIENFGEDREIKLYRSEGNNHFSDYPLVVLINEGSASGSEILAGALKYHNNAQIVGMPSFGKGSVQQGIKMREGSMLKVTISRWLTPDGKSISEKGIAPDFEVELTEEDYQKDSDPQLEKAIEVMKKIT